MVVDSGVVDSGVVDSGLGRRGAGRPGRLTVRREFLRVAAARCSAARPGLVVQMARRRHGAPATGKNGAGKNGAGENGIRAGFTASRKVGGAVRRNRARRRLREAARAILPEQGQPGVDYVLIARPATAERPWPELLDDLRQALRSLARRRAAAGRRA